MSEQSGILQEGARRVWKSQRIVWWLFLVNLLLAFLTTRPLSARLAQVTDHSLQSQRLVNGFDLGAYSELTTNPDAAFSSVMGESNLAIVVFFVFALFLTSGILATYHSDYRLTSSNFSSLFWLYFRISLLAWLGLALGMWLWTHIPGQHSGLSFVICEFVLLWWIGTRLWQRASEMVWYERRALTVAAATAVIEAVPSPESSIGAPPTN